MRHQSGHGHMTNLSLKQPSAGPAGLCMWQSLPAPSGTCAMPGVRLPPIMLKSKHLPLLHHALRAKQRRLDDHALSGNLHALQKCWPVFHACMPPCACAWAPQIGLQNSATASGVSFIMLMCITSTCVGHINVALPGLEGPTLSFVINFESGHA